MPSQHKPAYAVQVLRERDLEEFRMLASEQPKLLAQAQVVCEAGRLAWREALEICLACGADLNGMNRGYRPLHAAIQEKTHGHTAMDAERLGTIAWLLENGADPELPAAWPAARALLIAAFAGLPEVVEVLLRCGAREDFFTATAVGKRKVFARELKKSPELARAKDAQGFTALHCACASRMEPDVQIEFVRALLEAGADLQATLKSWAHDVDALYFAANSGKEAVFALLLKRGASADAGLNLGLWQKGFTLAEIALGAGADVNAKDPDGWPLLNQMIRWGRVEQTLWLLEQGARVDGRSPEGKSALEQAMARGNQRLIAAVRGA